jgi:hypothetical protein
MSLNDKKQTDEPPVVLDKADEDDATSDLTSINAGFDWLMATMVLIDRTFTPDVPDQLMKKFLLHCLEGVQQGVSDPMVRESFDSFMLMQRSSFLHLKAASEWATAEDTRLGLTDAHAEEIGALHDRGETLDCSGLTTKQR